MSKKKEIKQIFENMEPEATEAPVEPTPSEPGKEMSVPEVDSAHPAEKIDDAEAPANETVDTPSQQDEDESPEDLLDDVRRSLFEEESQEQEEQPKWWRKIGRSSRKKVEEGGKAQADEDLNTPAVSAIPAVQIAAEASQESEEDEYQDQIDELIDLLEEDEAALETSSPIETEAPVEPEKPVDIEELKKQAFQSRPVEEEKESLTEVRSIALEGGDEVFVEVESAPQDPLEERLSAVENALKPYQRYIYFGFAFLGLVMAVMAILVMYNAYQRSVAREAAVEEVSDMPFPTSVSLPGGWSFELGKGTLKNGRWSPAGAEWLQGTEVCRWVALPYTRQLEAVIRTLNPDDPIELGMSNSDKLIYSVYSIKQMSPEEMQELDSNSPCLLVVLAEPDSEKRWVLTALP